MHAGSGQGARRTPPTRLDSFVGRSEELARIEALLETGTRLVTVTGPGGMGKTRVALEVAKGAPFADASDARTPDELLSTIAEAVGVRGASITAESIASRAKTSFLVVDELEHLVNAGGTDVIATLLGRAPKLQLLVTSRVRLNLPGEHVVELRPLDEASRLFVERAQASASSFAGDAALVEEIVDAVDRIPLAIELCASRVRLLGLARLRDELRSATTLAVVGSSLRRAIEGSWRLLDDAARTTLARCSIFHGSFDLAGVVAVLELGSDRSAALDRMQILHDRSLLRAELGRFRLYESVREFAAEHLDEREHVASLHAAHYVGVGAALADAADGPDGRSAREMLALEAPNLLAIARESEKEEALAALLALEPVLSERGPLDLYASLLDDAMAASTSSSLRVRGLLARARVDVTRGRFADAVRIFGEARAAAVPGTAPYALATSKVAVLGTFLGHPGTDAFFADALALAKSLDDARLIGVVLSDRASAASRHGDEKSALADRELTVDYFTRANDAHRRAVALGYLGSSYLATGRFVEAERSAARAVEELRAQGDTRTEGQVLGFLARARHGSGRFADARASLRAALTRLQSAGDRWFEGVFEGWLGDVFLEDDSAADALDRYERAIALLDAANERHYAGLFHAASLVARALLDASASSEPPLSASALPATVSMAVRLHEAHARFLRAPDSGADARAVLEESSAAVLVSDDVRFAARLLRARVDRPASTPDNLVIGPNAHWFARGAGSRVSLERHGAVRRLLLRLAEARLTTPGISVARTDLVAAGWPGERIHPEAAVNRLNVSLTRLKRLGLRDLLRTRDDGLLIDPKVTVTFETV